MKKTNYKKAEPTLDEFKNDIAYLFYKYSGNSVARLFGEIPQTLRVRAKKAKGEK